MSCFNFGQFVLGFDHPLQSPADICSGLAGNFIYTSHQLIILGDKLEVSSIVGRRLREDLPVAADRAARREARGVPDHRPRACETFERC